MTKKGSCRGGCRHVLKTWKPRCGACLLGESIKWVSDYNQEIKSSNLSTAGALLPDMIVGH